MSQNAPLMLLESADAFGEEATHYRRELLVHCYRMLGRIDEAEDAVQEAFARAWQGRETFRRSVSLRAWLYRIATNVCLNAITSRSREPVATIGPFPDDLVVDDSGPEAQYDIHESISLAFLTVLQLLPPRQRAVLLLRDVLTFRAAEVAALLEMTVPAVNSAHQRARASLRSGYRRASPSAVPRDLLERYVRAWQAADVAGLVALLREDAVLAMPPQPTVVGAMRIGDFLSAAIFAMGPTRLVVARSNRSPTFALYVRRKLFALLVLAGDDQHIGRIDAFSDARELSRFDLPPQLDED